MSKILIYPDKQGLLRQKAKQVTDFGPDLKNLIKKLNQSLIPDPKDPQGVGLAATQIGQLHRVFLATLPDKKIHVIVNPQIIKTSKKMLSDLPQSLQFYEGCLSFPGLYGFVDRPNKIKVRYQNQNGLFKEKTLSSPHASYFMHERDHLDGKLFIDYIQQSGEQLYKVNKKSNQLVPIKFPFK